VCEERSPIRQLAMVALGVVETLVTVEVCQFFIAFEGVVLGYGLAPGNVDGTRDVAGALALLLR